MTGRQMLQSMQGRPIRLMSAAVAGALTVAGFAPLGFSPLPVLALTLLFVLWNRAASAREAALTGFLFGLACFLGGVSWVYVSLHDFGMMAAPVAAVATLLFCAYLALFPAAAGYLQARFRTGPAVTLLLTAPALWTLTEWLRGWLFSGFPWLAVGYSQGDSPLAGFAPLGGVYAVTLATTLTAGLIAYAMSCTGLKRLAAVAGMASLLLSGWLLRYPDWTQPEGAPVPVALVQGNIPQSMKFDPARYAETLGTYRRLIDGVDARIVVLPETAIPRFLDLVDPGYLESLEKLAATASADLLIGAPLRDRSGAYYNAMVTLGSSPSQAYRKSHLVPFGEFIPPAFGWVLDLLQIPLSDFSRGRLDQSPLELAGGVKVAINICYEDAFGEEIIRQLPDANLLINASNVAWFGNSLAPSQHLQISRMRAIETGRPMLRATNTGVTAIIDAHGTVVSQLPQFSEGVLRGVTQPMSGRTPYVIWGNSLVMAAVAGMLLTAWLAALTRRKASRRAGHHAGGNPGRMS